MTARDRIVLAKKLMRESETSCAERDRARAHHILCACGAAKTVCRECGANVWVFVDFVKSTKCGDLRRITRRVQVGRDAELHLCEDLPEK